MRLLSKLFEDLAVENVEAGVHVSLPLFSRERTGHIVQVIGRKEVVFVAGRMNPASLQADMLKIAILGTEFARRTPPAHMLNCIAVEEVLVYPIAALNVSRDERLIPAFEHWPAKTAVKILKR